MSQLSAARLQKRYKARTVVHDVSLDVASGEVDRPAGAQRRRQDDLLLHDRRAGGGRRRTHRARRREPLASCRSISARARGLSYLPQEASIFRKLTVAENVRAILELQDLDPDTLSNRLDALLEDLSISHLRRRAGGLAVRRRAAARARSRARSRRGRASSCSTSRSPASTRSRSSTSRRSSASSRIAASAC